VVTQGKMQPRRQLVCFCTSCWSFTGIHHRREAQMDISFFKQFNHETGKFHRALPYADEQHPRRIRGPITDHELDHFRRDRLRLRKAGGPDKDTNELYRSLTMEELTVVRVWADRVLQDAQSASSVLTDKILNCSIRLLHKGGDTSDKPSDWRPIGLLNVGIQLVHHIINYRLTIITEADNLIVPGQDGGRAGRGVDLNQLKLDWVTSEAKRLKQRIIRIDIDFKNAFNSMSQTALWAVMRAYNIPRLAGSHLRPDNCMHGLRRRRVRDHYLPHWCDSGGGILPSNLYYIHPCSTGALDEPWAWWELNSSTISLSWTISPLLRKTAPVRKSC